MPTQPEHPASPGARARLRQQARRVVYRSFERSPSLYCGALRRRVHTVNVVDNSTDLVIEGFPRSGNSFAREAIIHANPGIRIASHVHQAAHALQAVRLGVPTVVLVRDPDAAIASAMFLDEFCSIDASLRWYRRFHRTVWPHRGGLVVATFDEVVTDLGAVIARINGRFGTSLRPFRHTSEGERAVFARLEEAATDGAVVDEYAVARPSTVRAALAPALFAAVRGADPDLRAACLAEKTRFARLAEGPSG